MQTQRTAVAAEKPLETPIKIEGEEADDFFNMVNDLLVSSSSSILFFEI